MINFEFLKNREQQQPDESKERGGMTVPELEDNVYIFKQKYDDLLNLSFSQINEFNELNKLFIVIDLDTYRGKQRNSLIRHNYVQNVTRLIYYKIYIDFLKNMLKNQILNFTIGTEHFNSVDSINNKIKETFSKLNEIRKKSYDFPTLTALSNNNVIDMYNELKKIKEFDKSESEMYKKKQTTLMEELKTYNTELVNLLSAEPKTIDNANTKLSEVKQKKFVTQFEENKTELETTLLYLSDEEKEEINTFNITNDTGFAVLQNVILMNAYKFVVDANKEEIESLSAKLTTTLNTVPIPENKSTINTSFENIGTIYNTFGGIFTNYESYYNGLGNDLKSNTDISEIKDNIVATVEEINKIFDELSTLKENKLKPVVVPVPSSSESKPKPINKKASSADSIPKSADKKLESTRKVRSADSNPNLSKSESTKSFELLPDLPTSNILNDIDVTSTLTDKEIADYGNKKTHIFSYYNENEDKIENLVKTIEISETLEKKSLTQENIVKIITTNVTLINEIKQIISQNNVNANKIIETLDEPERNKNKDKFEKQKNKIMFYVGYLGIVTNYKFIEFGDNEIRECNADADGAVKIENISKIKNIHAYMETSQKNLNDLISKTSKIFSDEEEIKEILNLFETYKNDAEVYVRHGDDLIENITKTEEEKPIKIYTTEPNIPTANSIFEEITEDLSSELLKEEEMKKVDNDEKKKEKINEYYAETENIIEKIKEKTEKETKDESTSPDIETVVKEINELTELIQKFKKQITINKKNAEMFRNSLPKNGGATGSTQPVPQPTSAQSASTQPVPQPTSAQSASTQPVSSSSRPSSSSRDLSSRPSSASIASAEEFEKLNNKFMVTIGFLIVNKMKTLIEALNTEWTATNDETKLEKIKEEINKQKETVEGIYNETNRLYNIMPDDSKPGDLQKNASDNIEEIKKINKGIDAKILEKELHAKIDAKILEKELHAKILEKDKKTNPVAAPVVKKPTQVKKETVQVFKSNMDVEICMFFTALIELWKRQFAVVKYNNDDNDNRLRLKGEVYNKIKEYFIELYGPYEINNTNNQIKYLASINPDLILLNIFVVTDTNTGLFEKELIKIANSVTETNLQMSYTSQTEINETRTTEVNVINESDLTPDNRALLELIAKNILEKDKFNEENKRLDTEIETKQQKLGSATEPNKKTIEGELQTLQNKKTENIDILQSLETIITQKSKELKEAVSKKGIKTSETHITKLVSEQTLKEIEKIKQETNKNEDELLENTTKLTEIEEQIAKVTDNIATNEADITEKENKIIENVKQLEEFNKQIETLNKAKEEQIQKISNDLSKSDDDKNTEKATLEAETKTSIEQIENQKNLLSEQNNRDKDELETAKKSLEKQNKKELEESKSEIQKIIIELNKKLGKDTTTKETVKKNPNINAELLRNHIVKNITKKETDLENLKTQIIEKKKAVENKILDLKAKKIEVEQNKVLVNSAQNEYNTTSTSEFNDKLFQAQNKLSTVEKEVTDLETEIREKEKELKTLEEAKRKKEEIIEYEKKLEGGSKRRKLYTMKKRNKKNKKTRKSN